MIRIISVVNARVKIAATHRNIPVRHLKVILSADREITQKAPIRGIRHPELATSIHRREGHPPIVSHITQLSSDVPRVGLIKVIVYRVSDRIVGPLVTKVDGHLTHRQIPRRLRKIAKGHKSLPDLRVLLTRELKVGVNPPDKNTRPIGRCIGQTNRRHIQNILMAVFPARMLAIGSSGKAAQNWELPRRISPLLIVGIHRVTREVNLPGLKQAIPIRFQDKL